MAHNWEMLKMKKDAHNNIFPKSELVGSNLLPLLLLEKFQMWEDSYIIRKCLELSLLIVIKKK